MNFDEYQEKAMRTAVYPKGTELVYPTLGLAGEAGEFANKVKKILRGDEDPMIRHKLLDELGDVLWYVSACASGFGASLDEVARRNIEKLQSRLERDQIKGSGDSR